jgi:glycosyltransferase involved in cell wall biosynthesis
MQKIPIISVVIPSFQHAPYVEAAVRSVLAQTYTDIEVIVVDDGSSDGTPDIVASIADPRLKLVRLRENRIDHARNVGVSMAIGKLIAFQNSDDLWHPGKLAAQIAVLEAEPSVGVVFTAIEGIDSVGNPLPRLQPFCDGKKRRSANQWLAELVSENRFCVSSAIMRREVWERVGPFRHSLRQISDMEMWVRCAAVTELFVLPDALTRMRILNDQNLSRRTPESAAIGQAEWAVLLMQYVESPLVERLPVIFSENAPMTSAPNRTILVCEFACSVANSGLLGARMFADRVLSDLLDDADSRAVLLNYYGGKIMHFFWSNRAALATASVPGVR